MHQTKSCLNDLLPLPIFEALPQVIRNIPEPVQRLILAPAVGAVYGAAHYGIMLAHHGIRNRILGHAVTASFNIPSYVLMHVIGNTFGEYAKVLIDYAQKLVGSRENSKNSYLRQFTWKIIDIPLSAAKKVDQVYSKILKIRTAEETEKLTPRELWLFEVLRLVFIKHVVDQIFYISAWELGRRGAEMLLNSTIVMIMPSSSLAYAVGFVAGFLIKSIDFIKQVRMEQKAELDEKFTEPQTKINDDYIQLKKDIKERLCSIENIFQRSIKIRKKIADLDVSRLEFKKRWKCYPSDDINALKDFVLDMREGVQILEKKAISQRIKAPREMLEEHCRQFAQFCNNDRRDPDFEKQSCKLFHGMHPEKVLVRSLNKEQRFEVIQAIFTDLSDLYSELTEGRKSCSSVADLMQYANLVNESRKIFYETPALN